jgi:hypothetical protein
MSDISPLRQTLVEAMAETGLSMKDLTVMSALTDPFRLDTLGNHRDGKWLADTAATLGLGVRRIHLRGLHYMILGQAKPDGSMYISDEDSWTWLEKALKAARWLDYIPFDQITDQRNAAPVVRIFEQPNPQPYISTQVDVDIPDADDIEPLVYAADFRGVQPYKLVMVGEKSSLDGVLAPIAEAYQADLYLPTGDISDTMVYQRVPDLPLPGARLSGAPGCAYPRPGPGVRVAVNAAEGDGETGRCVVRRVRGRADRD